MLHLREARRDGFVGFERAGYGVPRFSVEAMRETSEVTPRWLHIGAGNLFRSFHARLAQDLLDAQLAGAGVHVLDTRDADRVRRAHRNDELFVDVVMTVDGQLLPTVVASVAGTIHATGPASPGWTKLAAIASAPSLQLVTLTVTEKAYSVPHATSRRHPGAPGSTIELLTELLLARFAAGAAPLAVVSTDNVADNGAVLASAVRRVAGEWVAVDAVEPGFLEYVSDEARVSFPISMVDRITPTPARTVAAALRRRFVFGDASIDARPGSAPLADFSNTEESHLLVVEDRFPNGRPPLEDVGVLFGDRKTVERVERMKVGACLNPLHTAMAVLGCLRGYRSIADVAADIDIAALVRRLAEDEALPAIEPPGVVDPRAFLDEVLQRRLPNRAIPDTPQRIATDTSQKLAMRFGGTIRHALATETDLVFTPVVIAAWLRYLLGVDDAGDIFQPSPDPRLRELRDRLVDVRFGAPESADGVVDSILDDPAVLGVGLAGTTFSDSVNAAFAAMLAGPGAVRNVVHSVVTASSITTQGAAR